MKEELLSEVMEREAWLKKVIAEKEKALQTAPSGRLRYNRFGDRIQYYHRTDPKDTVGKYIKKEERDLAAALAQKDYDNKVLKQAKEEKFPIGMNAHCIWRGQVFCIRTLQCLM